MQRFLNFFIIFCSLLFFLTLYFFSSSIKTEVQFEVKPGASAYSIGNMLVSTNVIRSARLFRLVASMKGVDKNINAGSYTVEPPISLLKIIDALANPDAREERTITILPGWDLRDIADYLETQGIATSSVWYRVAGMPAHLGEFASPLVPEKPTNVSLEGYIAPDTYRIFADATPDDIVKKVVTERMSQLADRRALITASGLTKHEVLTLASIVEREARTPEARAMIADIFLRRLKAGWALQADSTVQYAIGKKGDVFTTGHERDSVSLWNTYKYPGLPPGPISNPSIASIDAVLHPTKNEYWYFISTLDGEMKYARTIEEHQKNVATYLR